VTAWYVAIPVVATLFGALLWVSGRVRNRNAAHGRHENGHTVHHDGPPLTARRLPAAGALADAYASLATPCERCGTDHIGGCGMRPGPGSLPAHLRPGVVLPSTPKLALAPALEPLPPTRVSLGYDPLPELLPAELTGEEAAALRERHAESLKRQGPIHLPPDPDLTITAGPGADEAYADVVKAGIHDGKTPPGEAPETVLERAERLTPEGRPSYWVEATNGHVDNDRLVESMLMRHIDPETLARMDAARALTNGNGPEASHG
jgi:hypothetical protein